MANVCRAPTQVHVCTHTFNSMDSAATRTGSAMQVGAAAAAAPLASTQERREGGIAQGCIRKSIRRNSVVDYSLLVMIRISSPRRRHAASPAHPATVDDEHLSREVCTGGTAEEYAGPREILCFSPPPCWDSLRDLAQSRWVREEFFVLPRSGEGAESATVIALQYTPPATRRSPCPWLCSPVRCH